MLDYRPSSDRGTGHKLYCRYSCCYSRSRLKFYMSKLPVITAQKTLKKLKKAGLQVERITGSHYILRSSDGARYAVLFPCIEE